ncbi:permease [Candidatus Falkowbacteria bacterium HGW-Falkowbacteria-2]|uniref:Permease n=1 Tax=Candidatus Falkowbacteria bacterium HGW-Falkowbacteria-2 TaxID=2013769 RepID=A0A2N2DYY2_9BACT|nr:MAG: permease [Candidatus Falkowbacteria bacterium HGW-Falkowbacteria-2]
MFYPLQLLADWLAFGLLGLSSESHLGESVHYFIFDSLKILLLLFIVNYLMAIIRHYLPVEKLRDFLASRKWYGADYLFAALFGTITPFCSCSSIPLFIGFIKAGIPLGVTLSYLIVSPLVNQVAVVLFASLFGWQVTIMYVVSAVLLGMVGGFILSRLKMERYVADYIWKIGNREVEVKSEKASIQKLAGKFLAEGLALTKKLTPYVLIGIAVGAAIHGFVPAGYFENLISTDNLLAVPLAVIAAVPLYANAVGVIPIMESLVAKGIPLGTAMAFMMAVVGLSLPEALILKKVMKMKLLIYFFGITTINIIIIGYLFNIFV